VARYLCDVIDGAMLTELARFKATRGYLGYRPSDRKTVSSSFLHGMASSVAEKLRTMKSQRDEIHRATGRDLVVVKAALVDEELAKLGMSFTTRRVSRKTVEKSAYYSGHQAGKKVAINPGVNAGPIRSALGSKGGGSS
jgi:hypothetical protein